MISLSYYVRKVHDFPRPKPADESYNDNSWSQENQGHYSIVFTHHALLVLHLTAANK